jgi:hypothetical protein
VIVDPTVGLELAQSVEESADQGVPPAGGQAPVPHGDHPGRQGRHDHAAGQQAGGQEPPGGRIDQRSQQGGRHTGAGHPGEGHHSPDEGFLGAVDVAGETPEQIAASELEQSGGGQGDEGGEDPGPDLGQQAEGAVMGRQPLCVAKQGSAQGEGAYPDDGDGQSLNVGVLRSSADQPDGSGGEGQAAHATQDPEDPGQDQGSPGAPGRHQGGADP